MRCAKRFGNWHTIYTRMNRWAKAGVLDRLFAELQRAQLIRIKIEAVSLGTIVKVHPDGTSALKKNGPQAIGKSRGGWSTKVHMVAASARCAIGCFHLLRAHRGSTTSEVLTGPRARDKPYVNPGYS